MNNINTPPEALKDIIFVEINKGSIDRLAELVKNLQPHHLDGMRNDYGYSFIAQACSLGEAEVTKVLIQAGADVDLIDDGGNYPLECAAWGRHTEVVQVLLDAGANPDPDLCGKVESTALDDFIRAGHPCYEQIRNARAIRKAADIREKLMEIPASNTIPRDTPRPLKF